MSCFIQTGLAGAMISIDLQDGFNQAAVTIQVDGEVVYDHHSVTTKRIVGLADSLDIDTTSDMVEIKIAAILAPDETPQVLALDVANDSHVGLYVESNRLRHQISREPFGYG